MPDRSAQLPSAPTPLAEQIARLEALDLPQLRVQFRNRTGRIAQTRISRHVLLRVLAYRMQAELHGDLRPETRRLLDRIMAADAAATEPGSKAMATPLPGIDRPRPGTVLVREWQGRLQHVMVLDDGFAWNGSSFASLSAVASAMTGTKWNGRRFFGLDRPSGQTSADASRALPVGSSGRPSIESKPLAGRARRMTSESAMPRAGATP